MTEAFDTDTVQTDVGTYRIDWHYDQDSGSPLDDVDTSTMMVYVHQSGVAHTDTIDPRDGSGAILRRLISEYGDDDAITRRYTKWRAISGSPWQLFTGSGSGSVQSHWWDWLVLVDTAATWTDADGKVSPLILEPERAANAVMDEYESWASGDVVSFVLIGPDGVEFEGCGGFIGPDGRRDARTEYVDPMIADDVAERLESSNLVGAGFIGIV